MWGDVGYVIMRNLTASFWFVMSFKVTAQIVFWSSGFMIEA